MKQLLLCLYLLFTISGCNHDSPKRETVKDNIIHLEDGLITEIPYLPRLCDSLDLVSFKVDVGDCLLHVEIEGKGDPIVLINGGPGGTHHYFHPWFSYLAKDQQLIYYDQRGTGQSEFNEGNGYSFEQAVNDLEILRRKLGIDTWTLCGFSYGGGLAQFYALKYPEHVNGLVLISALPMLANEDLRSEQDLYLSDSEKAKKNEIITSYLDGKIDFKPFLYNLALNGDWKRQHYLKPTANQMIRSALYEWVNDKEFNDIMSTSYSNYDFKNAFDKFPIPTLIIEGEEDLTWGSSKANIFRNNHPNAQFFKLSHTAHTLFSEQPEVVFSILWSFTSNLNEVSSSQILNWKKSQTTYKNTLD